LPLRPLQPVRRRPGPGDRPGGWARPAMSPRLPTRLLLGRHRQESPGTSRLPGCRMSSYPRSGAWELGFRVRSVTSPSRSRFPRYGFRDTRRSSANNHPQVGQISRSPLDFAILLRENVDHADCNTGVDTSRSRPGSGAVHLFMILRIHPESRPPRDFLRRSQDASHLSAEFGLIVG
jgi:hypothetical protein